MVTKYWIFPGWLQRRITAWYVAGGAILVLALGVDVTLIVERGEQWFLFQRAGALLVLIGIWLGFYGLVQLANVASRGQWTVDVASSLGAERIRRRHRGKSDADIEALIAARVDRAKQDAEHAVQTAQGIHWLAQAIPLALGTVFWAFGDLISKAAAFLYLLAIAP